MAEGYWATRTYKVGRIGEKIKYWIPGKKPSRSERRLKTDIKKQEQNETNAIRRLARDLNDPRNFEPGDLLLGLDYSEKGMARLLAWIEEQEEYREIDMNDETKSMDAIYAAAEHELELALRRVKRCLAKEAVGLHAAYITSDMDGETGETVRIHHHLVVNKESKQAFVEKWEKLGMGGVDWETMWKWQDDRTPISEYFIKQVRHVPDAKKYKTTRNLIRAVPKDRVAITSAELRPPKGARLLHRSEYKPGRPQYIRYLLPEEKEYPDSLQAHTRGSSIGKSRQSAKPPKGGGG